LATIRAPESNAISKVTILLTDGSPSLDPGDQRFLPFVASIGFFISGAKFGREIDAAE